MRILFICHAFHPSVGGIESSALLLIREFLALGHEVRVVTHTPLGDAEELAHVEIHRRPGPWQQAQLARWADVVYQHNPSLTYWLPLLVRPRGVVSVHTWVARTDGRVSPRDRLKRLWMRRWHVIANSRAMAAALPMPSNVIENAYDDQVFNDAGSPGWAERAGAVFVGRLVSDKGAEVAVRAVAELQSRGRPIPLTVVGEGPERESLQATAKLLGLEVQFLGRRPPAEVAHLLRQARYLVVPSLWEEPFGIVVLEGIAAGCIVIASDRGGLADALGGCGVLVPAGNAAAMAGAISRCEEDEALRQACFARRTDHLRRHAPRAVAEAHLEVFEKATGNAGRSRSLGDAA